MGGRGNRWQKSIMEKKKNSIRIMFLMVVGNHVSSLVLLFWHVCLTHIDTNLLSHTLCGPCAQPCGSSSVSSTWVCSNRNCQIFSLFTTRVHPMLSDARLGKECLVSGSLQICDGPVRFQKPSAKLELYSSRQKPSCRSPSMAVIHPQSFSARNSHCFHSRQEGWLWSKLNTSNYFACFLLPAHFVH